MSRILIAWEMGANLGHLVRCLRIANALRERGHPVGFAVRDTRTAAEILDKAGFAYFQAPIQSRTLKPTRPPANFSEILINQGYADYWALHGMTCAWFALYRLYRPNVILADHAPTALFSAKLAGIPAIPIGNGFAVPPPLSPQPSIRPFEEIPLSRLQRADEVVNKCMEVVSKELGGKKKNSPTLISLYDTNPLLDFFPEFDHFGERLNANYIGPIFGLPNSQTVEWEGKKNYRVLAYLRAELKCFPALLRALRESEDIESIVVSPRLTAKQIHGLASPNLRIYNRAINLSSVLPQTDVMVNQGNTGSMAESLLAGVPMMLVPHYIEQYLASVRVSQIGASITHGSNDRNEERINSHLRQLLDDKSFKQKARSFAHKYSDFDSNSPVEAAVSMLEYHA